MIGIGPRPGQRIFRSAHGERHAPGGGIVLNSIVARQTFQVLNGESRGKFGGEPSPGWVLRGTRFLAVGEETFDSIETIEGRPVGVHVSFLILLPAAGDLPEQEIADE